MVLNHKTHLSMRECIALDMYNAFFSFLHDEDSVALEATRRMDRSKLNEKFFGIPSKKKYPLTQESSIKNCIRFFRFCPNEDKKELATNVLKAMESFHMTKEDTYGEDFWKFVNEMK